jgi:hypothetical protein
MIDLVLAVAGVAVILAELFIWEPESFGMSRNVTGATFRLLDDRAMSIYPDHSLGLSVPRRRLLVLVRRLIIPIAGLFIFVACPGVCFGSDPVSSVSFNGPKAQAELSRKASNGYSILFEVNRGKASLTARSDEGTVIYSGKGSLVNGRIHFGLGKLGRINADSSRMDRLIAYGHLSPVKAVSRWSGVEPLSGRSNFVARVVTRDSTRIECTAVWLLRAHGNVWLLLLAAVPRTPPVCQLSWVPLRRTGGLSLLPLVVLSYFRCDSSLLERRSDMEHCALIDRLWLKAIL